MEDKIFRVPPECRTLNPYFWKLKHAACAELQEQGITTEPSQSRLEELQKICNSNPKGAVAFYVQELQKGFRMSKEDLVAYDKTLQTQQTPPPQSAEDAEIEALAIGGNEMIDTFGDPDDEDWDGSFDLDMDADI